MMRLIGVDCATRPEKTGLALGEMQPGMVRLIKCGVASRSEPPDKQIVQWLREEPEAVIAIDAPLGWAKPFADGLNGHAAGQPLEGGADRLFRRATDIDVQSRFSKRPLENGANLISRTAVAALELISSIRRQLKADIPLAWSSNEISGPCIIEVYPAVTLKARKVCPKKWSVKDLRGEMDCQEVPDLLGASTDARDAAICVLAAADFVRGKAKPPDDPELAKAEGWIWVAERSAPPS